MKKQLIVLLAIAALFLAACGENAPPETPEEPSTPVVSAGADDLNPTLAADLTVTLTGSATVDGSTITAYDWSAESAPGGVTPVFGTPDEANTTVTGLTKAGTYIFKLSATSAADKINTDTVTVVVKGYTVPETITVSYPAYASGNLTTSFEPTNLPAGVTYTLEDGDGLVSHTSGVVSASPYAHNSVPIFTQIFYKGSHIPENEVGRQVVGILVRSGNFMTLIDKDGSTTLSDQTAFPDVDLALEKTITEL